MPAGRIGEISLHAVSCLVRLRLKNLLSITIAINAWPGISFDKVPNVFSGRLKVLDLQLNCLNKASIKSNDVKYNLRWIEYLEYLPRIFGMDEYSFGSYDVRKHKSQDLSGFYDVSTKYKTSLERNHDAWSRLFCVRRCLTFEFLSFVNVVYIKLDHFTLNNSHIT